MNIHVAQHKGMVRIMGSDEVTPVQLHCHQPGGTVAAVEQCWYPVPKAGGIPDSLVHCLQDVRPFYPLYLWMDTWDPHNVRGAAEADRLPRLC